MTFISITSKDICEIFKNHNNTWTTNSSKLLKSRYVNFLRVNQYLFTTKTTAFYYPGESFLLAGVGKSFRRSSPPTIPIPYILSHTSPLSHIPHYHINPSLHGPNISFKIYKWTSLSINFSYFNSNLTSRTWRVHIRYYCRCR